MTELTKSGGQNLRAGEEYRVMTRVMGEYASSLEANIHRTLFGGATLKKVKC